eukprot:SAG22_NODE_1916_length_3316_cov_6.514454_3_plen_107_part_00
MSSVCPQGIYALAPLVHDMFLTCDANERSCESTALDKTMAGLSAAATFGLFYSIYIRLAKVLHGYLVRYVMVLHLAHMVPWAGMVAHKRFSNHGLLPTFELDCPVS